jgi:hypothetical protein
VFAAAQAAVRALAQSGGVKLVAPTHAGGGGPAATGSSGGGSGVSSSTPGQGADTRVALLAAVTVLLVGAILGVRVALRRRRATLEGLPTTIFINSNGKVVFVHTGQYDSQGTLDADIAYYAQAG